MIPYPVHLLFPLFYSFFDILSAISLFTFQFSGIYNFLEKKKMIRRVYSPVL